VNRFRVCDPVIVRMRKWADEEARGTLALVTFVWMGRMGRAYCSEYGVTLFANKRLVYEGVRHTGAYGTGIVVTGEVLIECAAMRKR
jgi:hypothetical protein